MKASKICEYLEQYFPLSLQEEWDRCGLQIGSLTTDVKKVMVALNADEESFDRAIVENCQMLITHHPFLLEKIENFDTDALHGRMIKKAMAHNLVVYSLHTCLDKGSKKESMNTWLLQKFDVSNMQNYNSCGIGKKGVLKQTVTTNTFIEMVKEQFPLASVRYNRGVTIPIKHIAICGGSAADDITELSTQVDCFITGDTKHKHMKIAIDNQIVLMDIGHHAEVIMEEKVKELLAPLSIEVVVANSRDYYV